MKKSKQQEIEDFYKMPFKDVIKIIHFEKGLSINKMAKECKRGRQTIMYICKKLKLKTRNQKESVRLSARKGEAHHNYGKNKTNSDFFKNRSLIMTKNNPMKNRDVSIKRALTMSKIFLSKPQPQEVKFKNILKNFKVIFEMQKAVDIFNLDFFIPSINLAIEIDSTSKWGNGHREKAKIRDDILFNNFGIKTLRINKNKLSDDDFVKDILLANNVICKK